MHSCKEICEITLKQGNEPLTWKSYFARFFHLMICGHCRLALKQFRLMKAALHKQHINTIEKASNVSDQQVDQWISALKLPNTSAPVEH